MIEIYTKGYCPYCRRAKSLLSQMGLSFIEHDVSDDPDAQREMVRKASGRVTVPQVFIGGVGIGGSDDLASLHRSGRLAELVAQEPETR